MNILKAFEGKKVLITGGLGFIGSNLARRLLELGAKVVLLDSLVPEYGGNRFNIEGLEKKLQVNIADVRDDHSMNYLVQDRDYLFNLAGQTSHLDSMQNPFTDLDINCRSQLSILESCRTYNPRVKVVFASTRQIYGKPDYLPVDEKHPLRPVDVNGVNKLAGENYHILYNQVYGIRTVSLRLTNTIGPRMRVKDSRQTFLGVWIRDLVGGKPFEVWEGGQLRDFTYVDDAVEAFLLAAASAEADGRIFNVGGERPVRLRELADLLVRINGGGRYEMRNFPSDNKRIDIGDYYADDRYLRKALGWKPQTSLEKALEQTLKYYRKNIEHYL